MGAGLKKDGEYARIISLPRDVQGYKPTFDDLVGQLDMASTVISLPHAHLTYRTIEEFEKRIANLVES